MPIPFTDLRTPDAAGLAGYLRFVDETASSGVRGGLFLVNSRGEPIEFTFTRIDLDGLVLWRSGESRRNAVANLASSLFNACSQAPHLLLALANEVHPQLFLEDVRVAVPLCRVDVFDSRSEFAQAGPGRSERISDSLNLFWTSEIPSDGSTERAVLNNLVARKMLTEPFERALAGIAEAFGESQQMVDANS